MNNEEALKTLEEKNPPLIEDAEDRICAVWALYLKNYPERAIARYLNISSEQVQLDVQFMRELQRQRLEQKTGLEHTTELASKYDEIYGIARLEFEKTRGRVKANFLQLALKSIQMKESLLARIGAIPTEPQKLEHSIKGQVTHEHVIRDERSEDEIRQSIDELARHGLILTDGE